MEKFDHLQQCEGNAIFSGCCRSPIRSTCTRSGPPSRTPNRWLGSYLTVMALLCLVTSSIAQVGTDFRQWANLPQRQWQNSILQSNNSAYYEGSSTLQRIVLVGVPHKADSLYQHKLYFSHEAYKSGRHAYDFVTGYDQARNVDYPEGSGGGDLNAGLTVFGNAIGPQASATLVQNLLAASSAAATVPAAGLYSSLSNAPPDNVAGKVNYYDGGNSSKRAVMIYGMKPISNAVLKLTGYSGNSADRYAEYELSWTSKSNDVLILMAGHLAVGRAGNGISYGTGKGAGSINGGPYHFKLDNIDGISLGSQDNQIMASAIIAPPSCEITGVAAICAGQSATFTGPADLDTYSWSVSGSGTITMGGNTQYVTVQAGASGSFTLTLHTIDDGIPSVDNCQLNVAINNASCSIPAAGPVCPNAVTTFTAAAANSYTWTISGNGSIIGGANSQTVTVQAGAGCNTSYTLSLNIGAGNTCNGACTQTVLVQDTTPPVIVNAPGNLPPVECPAIVQWPTVTAVDNCSGPATVTTRDRVLQGNCHDSYTLIRTWIATDACGNIDSASASVMVVDTTPPVFTFVPANQTVSCTDQINWGMATAEDACCLAIISHNDVTTPGNCAGNYIITRTWTVVDHCGNSNTATTVITVVDNVPPVITQPAAGGTIACGMTPNFTNPTATDNCSGATVEQVGQDVTAGNGCLQTVTRTWRAVDGCGNASLAVSQTITIIDNVPPVITQPGPVAPIACSAPGALPFTPPTATDACTTATVIQVGQDVPGGSGCSTTVTRTWRAVDACGNQSGTVSQTITIIDNVNPVFTFVPGNTTINCPAVPQFGTATATDNCGPVNITFNDVRVNGRCVSEYCITRTWTATDACGNTATASQQICVVDNVPPVFSNVPADKDVQCGQPIVWGTPTAFDACCAPLVIVEDSTSAGNCPGTYTITRKWTARDLCGNITVVRARIHVIDTVPPVIGAPGQNATIACPAQPEFTAPTATDACSTAVVTQVGQDVTVVNGCTTLVTRTWRATDLCGNQSGPVSQTITIIDNTAPVIGTPIVIAPIACPAPAVLPFVAPTATDVCTTAVVVQVGQDVITGNNCERFVTRTWRAVDACGNQSGTVSQTITIIDNVAPVIGTPIVIAPIACPAPAVLPFVAPTATDACTTATVIQVGQDVTAANGCTTLVTRTWRAVDACGNQSGTVSQTITIIDNVAPVISTPVVIAPIECPAPAVLPFVAPTAVDACTTAVVEQVGIDVVAGSGCLQTVTRTWRAVDACGNASGTVSQTITIQDTTPPVANIPAANDTIYVECPAPTTPLPYLPPVVQDNCDQNPNITFTDRPIQNPGGCVSTIIFERTFTVQDACGNQAPNNPLVQIIIIRDTTPPVISTPIAIAPIECPAPAVLPFVAPTATDACSTATVIQVGQDVTVVNGCTTLVTRTWRAVDACSNQSGTVSQTITILDTTPPVITTPVVIAPIECPANGALPFVAPTATDACGAATVEQVGQDVVAGNSCLQTVTRTWRAVDLCGNASGTVSQVITIRDTTPPVFSNVPPTQTIECPATVQFNAPTVTDACNPNGIVVTSVDRVIPGECHDNYTLVRTWTATDICGNVAMDSARINVVDTRAPIFTFVPPAQTVSCTDQINFGTATAFDSCCVAFLEFEDDTVAGNCPGNYVITRTWRTFDHCGNTATATTVITVVDNVAPVIGTPIAIAPLECPVDGVLPFVAPTATDNCSGATVQQVGQDVMAGNACLRTVTRTWRAVDACGNQSGTVSQTITIRDTTAPVYSFVPGAVAPIECPAPAVLPFTPPTATDVCNAVTIEQVGQDVVGGNACLQTVTRTWRAVDACGNAAAPVSQVITIRDTTPPVIGTPVAVAPIECPAPAQLPFVAPTATDACTTAVVIQVGQDVVGGNACLQTVTRTWRAVDACGNQSGTVSQTITIRDTTPPVIGAPIVIAPVECPAPAVLPFVAPTATDACTTAVVVQVGQDVIGGNACLQTVTRTWRAVDACGNQSGTVSQTITIRDTTPPVIGTPIIIAPIECPTPAVLPFVAPTATDACTTAVVVQVGQDVTTGNNCERFVTRTWRAVDACGNQSGTVSQTITIRDTTPPVISAPVVIAPIECPAPAVLPFVAPTAVDACTTATVIQVGQDVVGGNACLQTVTRTWRAVDACGNQSGTVSQTITIRDTTPPVIGTPIVIAPIECPANGALPFVAPGATDACNTYVVEQVGQDVTTGNACLQLVTRTWRAVDACGNASGNVSQTITIRDTTPPVIGTPVVIAPIECPAPAVLPFVAPGATDNCNTFVVEQVGQDVMTGTACLRFVTRTYRAVDACGNASGTVSQTITIRDTNPPVFSNVPANQTIQCDQPLVWGNPTAIDACNGATVTFTDQRINGACPQSYTVQRTWRAEDACGNFATVTRSIIVIDNVAPVFVNVPADQTIECNTTPMFGNATATDNCDNDVTITFTDAQDSVNCCTSRIVRTWTATDDCGNSVTATTTITIVDTTPPVITNVPATTTVECNGGPLVWPNISATDNCSAVKIETRDVTTHNGCCLGKYSVTRTWIVSDQCGNTASASSTINVVDNTPPTLVCAPDKSIGCNDQVVFDAPTVTDNCGTPELIIVSTTVTTNPVTGVITHVRVWRAEDPCANLSVSCTQTITQLSCPPVVENVAHCSLTQGFYGNSGGRHCDGRTTTQLLTDLLATDLVIGGGSNTLTLTQADVACLISRLPGGGPIAKLNGAATCGNPVGIVLNGKGRFNNSLLAQTITLGLNLRLDPTLGSVVLSGTTMTATSASGCGAPGSTANGSVKSNSIHPLVLSYLGSSNTVADLLVLANEALSGAYVYAPGRPTIAHISNAVGSINNTFDKCGIQGASTSVSTARTTAPDEAVEEELVKEEGSIVLNAYPNPFTYSTTIEFSVPQSESNVTLDLYDLKGAHVQRLFKGAAEAGQTYTVKLEGSPLQQGFYFGRLVTGDKVEHLRMLLQR